MTGNCRTARSLVTDAAHPSLPSSPHRHLRSPKRRQVVAAERDHPAARVDRVGGSRDDHRPGREADGAVAARAGAVRGHGGRGRRGSARRAADRADQGGAGPGGPWRRGHGGRRLGRVRGRARQRTREPTRAGARGVQQVRPADARREGTRAPSAGAHPVGDRVVAERRGGGGRARSAAVAGAGRLLRQPPAGDRPRAPRRGGGARRPDRQGSAEGAADPAAGDGHPRPARRRVDGARRPGARAAAGPRAADAGRPRSS